MISEEKVKIMTRIARFERNEKEALKAGRYFASDYIVTGLLRAFAAYTVLFGLVMLMILLYHCEILLSEGTVDKFIDLAWRIGLSYLILLIPLAVILYLVNWVRYRRFINVVKSYRRSLKELDTYYQNEAKADRGGTTE